MVDPKSKVDKSNRVCLPNFQPHYNNGVKNTKTGLPPVPAGGGQYPQVFEAAILLPHKEDASAKIFFWPLLSLQMLLDMLGYSPLGSEYFPPQRPPSTETARIYFGA